MHWYEMTTYKALFPGEKKVRPASDFNRAAPSKADDDNESKSRFSYKSPLSGGRREGFLFALQTQTAARLNPPVALPAHAAFIFNSCQWGRQRLCSGSDCG
jgi:hypothetical protein